MGDNEHRLSMIKNQKELRLVNQLMHVIQCVGGQYGGNHLCNSPLHQHLEWIGTFGTLVLLLAKAEDRWVRLAVSDDIP